MRAHCYYRFSPRPDPENSQSIENQKAACRAYVTACGFELASEHDDPEASGKSTEGRPGLEAAIQAACASKGVLVVASLDRLARSLIDACEISQRLNRCGAQLAMVRERLDTTTPAGEMIYRILASVAEFERKLIAQRISQGIQRRRQDGQIMGRPDRQPYGWKAVGVRYRVITDKNGNARRRVVSGRIVKDVEAWERLTLARVALAKGATYEQCARILQVASPAAARKILGRASHE